MNQDGFSLIEMLTVMTICVVLITLSALSYNRWTAKGNIETQFKRMYSDLLGVRSQALYRKKARSVRITSTAFTIYSSSVDPANTTISPIRTTTLKFPVTTNPGNLQVDFDKMGRALSYVTGGAVLDNFSSCICVQATPSKAFYNSIIVSPARIQIGNLSGTGCRSANIKPQ